MAGHHSTSPETPPKARSRTDGHAAIDVFRRAWHTRPASAAGSSGFVALIHPPVRNAERRSGRYRVQRLVFVRRHVAGASAQAKTRWRMVPEDQAGQQLVFGRTVPGRLHSGRAGPGRKRGRNIGLQRPAEAREDAGRQHQIAGRGSALVTTATLAIWPAYSVFSSRSTSERRSVVGWWAARPRTR